MRIGPTNTEVLTLSYNPMELTEKVREKVIRKKKRKYYRFRSTKFYGGIATADCIGCNLMCRFCWSEEPRTNPEEKGSFHSPSEVAEKLVDIAHENGHDRVRISGNEPTIGKRHLLSVLDEIEGSNLRFVLETNGILIGADPSFAKELATHRNLIVRVSLKGANRKQFKELTGSEEKGFDLQLKSLENLVEEDCACRAAVMKQFLDKDLERELRRKLNEISLGLARGLEFERLKLYPHVRKRLEEHGLGEYAP